jgi:hypothetical protein
MIFSFASQDTRAGVLLQKNKDDYEQPITFMSKTLSDAELKYSIIEKQAYALVKSLKHLGAMLVTIRSKHMYCTLAVKDVLSEQDCLGTRGNVGVKIQEYDLEIKPTKIIKGQGLAKMLIEINEEAIKMG